MKRTPDGYLHVDFRKASVAETVSFVRSFSFLFFFVSVFLESPWSREGWFLGVKKRILPSVALVFYTPVPRCERGTHLKKSHTMTH